MSKEIEKTILSRSHDDKSAQDLLDNRYSLGGDQKPFLHLDNTTVPIPLSTEDKTKYRPQRRIARDSLRQYIKHSNPPYSSFASLNSLWNEYLTDLLSNHTGSSTTAKLASCDYHGAHLTVVQSRNPALVGISGICIWEAKSAFVLCTRDTRKSIKSIEKKGTKFRIGADVLKDDTRSFEIIGSRFLFRAAERSGRKFKPKAIDDL